MNTNPFIPNANNPELVIFNTHMDIVAKAFSDNRISALVGTGFSKNAKAIDPAKKIPLWDDVGIRLMNDLGISMPNNKLSFQDPIRLSSLYSAQFNPSQLDTLLMELIDDNNFEPVDVHTKFVQLNWNNIYTTNYDTLLERAANKINKKYSIVKKDKDFPKALIPRIIKLHGSFPSETPFIMTDEHFRKYPSEHPIFVNSVQQSLIEDTMVLFGFSGNDPNFIKWSGWIRDNLGYSYAKRIFLISITPPSDSEIKLFHEQNITILDLSLIFNYYKISIDSAFIKMFNYWQQFSQLNFNNQNLQCNNNQNINSKGNVSNNSSSQSNQNISSNLNNSVLFTKNSSLELWISNLWKPEIDMANDLNDNNWWTTINKISQIWEKERLQYPKVPILTQYNSNQLFWKTKIFSEYNNFFAKIDNNTESINFLYELNWRWNKCNIPLYGRIINAYKKALGLSNKTISINNFSTDIKRKAIELLVSLYKASREDENFELCNIIDELFNNNIQYCDDYLINSIYYERCLTSIAQLHFRDFIQQINAWSIDNSKENIVWNIKKAGLLAEIGKEDDAIDLLQELKNIIDLENENEKETEDLFLLFHENLVNWLIVWISESKRFDKNFKYKDIDLEKLRNRNKVLYQYNCDIYEILHSYYDSIYLNNANLIQKQDFDDSRKSQSSIESTDIPFSSFIIVNILEKIGFPYRISNSTFINSNKLSIAIKNIFDYQPEWALILIIRTYNESVVEQIINKQDIIKFSSKSISEFISEILFCFAELEDELMNGSDFLANNYSNRIIKTFPELLSRLCSKTNSKTRLKLCTFLTNIFNKNLMCRMPNLENLVKRLSKSLTLTEKSFFIQKLSTVNPPLYRPIDEDRVLNPFTYLYPHNQNEVSKIVCKVNQNRIYKIIENYSKCKSAFEEKWYLTTLIALSFWNLLDNSNKQAFGTYLWESDKDQFGLPKLVGFYKATLLKLPHPDTINVENLYKNLLMNTNVPIISKETVHTYPADTSWYYNILKIDNPIVFTDIFWQQLLIKIEQQWKNDSLLLYKNTDNPFFDVNIQAIDNFYYSSKLLNKLIIFNIEKLNDKNNTFFSFRDRIYDQIILYFKNHINCMEAFSSLILLGYKEFNEIFIVLKLKLASYDNNEVIDALNAILSLIELKNEYFSEKYKHRLVDLIIESIMWQCRADLTNCLNEAKLIVVNNSELITKDNIYLFCKSLGNIRKTLINSEDIDQTTKTKIKSAAAGLASAIHDLCVINNIKLDPEIIEWKNISQNEDEFSEIRNQWSY